MLGVNFKNKREKKALLVGLGAGVFAGAFLPDKYNPVVLVKGLFNRQGGTGGSW